MPAWCTPTPASEQALAAILPKAVVKRVPFMASLISSRCSFVRHAVAGQRPRRSSSAASCEKCTMYSGASPARRRQLHGAFQRHLAGVVVGQRHGARRVGRPGRRDVPVRSSSGGGDVAHVAERGAHQQELRIRQREQRHLPGPAAVGVGVEVELVHRHAGHRRRRRPSRSAWFARISAVQQMTGASVLMVRVARDHAHVLAAEDVHHVEELLADTSALMGAV